MSNKGYYVANQTVLRWNACQLIHLCHLTQRLDHISCALIAPDWLSIYEVDSLMIAWYLYTRKQSCFITHKSWNASKCSLVRRCRGPTSLHHLLINPGEIPLQFPSSHNSQHVHFRDVWLYRIKLPRTAPFHVHHWLAKRYSTLLAPLRGCISILPNHNTLRGSSPDHSQAILPNFFGHQFRRPWVAYERHCIKSVRCWYPLEISVSITLSRTFPRISLPGCTSDCLTR